MLQRSASAGQESLRVDSASREPENYEVLVVEGEELEVDEPAFGKLVAGAVEQSGSMYL